MTIEYAPFSDGFSGGTPGREVYLTHIRDKGKGSENISKKLG